MTVMVAGWTVPPGDISWFGPLRDREEVRAFKGRLRRAGGHELLVLGSVEALFKTVANCPVGKVFHAHFLVSGVTDDQIREAASRSFELDPHVPRPLDIQPVGPAAEDFVRVASYCFAQPFWKTAFVAEDSRKGVPQFPKRSELAELIASLGPHPWNGRLVTVGLRFDQGRFRLTQPRIDDSPSIRGQMLKTDNRDRKHDKG